MGATVRISRRAPTGGATVMVVPARGSSSTRCAATPPRGRAGHLRQAEHGLDRPGDPIVKRQYHADAIVGREPRRNERQDKELPPGCLRKVGFAQARGGQSLPEEGADCARVPALGRLHDLVAKRGRCVRQMSIGRRERDRQIAQNRVARGFVGRLEQGGAVERAEVWPHQEAAENGIVARAVDRPVQGPGVDHRRAVDGPPEIRPPPHEVGRSIRLGGGRRVRREPCPPGPP